MAYAKIITLALAVCVFIGAISVQPVAAQTFQLSDAEIATQSNLLNSPAETSDLQFSSTELKNPWAAVGIGMGSSLAIAGVMGLTQQSWLAVPSLLMTGAGQVYACDTTRGLLVSLGSVGALLAAVLGGTVVWYAVPSDHQDASVPVNMQHPALGIGLPAITGLAVWGAYEVWAGYDAYQAALSANEKMTTPQGKTP